MGWLQNYGNFILGNLADGVKDGLKSVVTGRSSFDVRRERKEREQKLARDMRAEADLDRLVEALNKRYTNEARARRARGETNYPLVTFTGAKLGDYPAIVRYGMNGDPGRVEIFYGGTGSNPMKNRDHGHIVIKHGTVDYWRESADPDGAANVLYDGSDRDY